MKIDYWLNFSKRKNSTLRPTSTGMVERDVVLKDNCSIMNPIFDTANVPDTVTYIYVPDFGRYYFVSDIMHVTKDRIEIHCTIDVLATYKGEIGGTTAFIARSSAVNLMLPDSNVVATNEIVHTDVTEGDTIPGSNMGIYVARFLGSCGIQSFCFSSLAQIQQVFNTYYTANLPYTSVPEAIKSLITAMADPAKYVLSLKMFAVDVDSGADDYPSWGFLTNTIQWDVAKETLHKQVVITKPALYYNDWRDYDSRFTSCSVRLPGVGNIDLDPKYLKTVLSCWYDIDVISGNCRVTLMAGSKIIGVMDGIAGADIPIGGISGLGGLAGVPGLVGALSLNPLNFAEDAARSVGKIIGDALNPPTSVLSARGNITEWIQNPFIQVSVTHRGSTEIAPIGEGRPDMNNRTISSLSGYMVCEKATVNLAGYDSERDAVNGYLNSGFYYE